MPHPVLDEIVRAKEPIRSEVLRRWQRAIRQELIPTIEAMERQLVRPDVKPTKPYRAETETSALGTAL